MIPKHGGKRPWTGRPIDDAVKCNFAARKRDDLGSFPIFLNLFFGTIEPEGSGTSSKNKKCENAGDTNDAVIAHAFNSYSDTE
jgi:hypothetical protein